MPSAPQRDEILALKSCPKKRLVHLRKGLPEKGKRDSHGDRMDAFGLFIYFKMPRKFVSKIKFPHF